MLARLLAAAMFLLCTGIVFWQALVHTVHRGTLAVPELRGSNLEQAERLAHDYGLTVVVDEPGVFTIATPVGSIAAQDPQPGFHVKTGSTITVRLSLGGERVTIPDIRGESLQGGLRGLEQIGLSPGRRAQIDGQTGGDRVLATEPPIGAQVAPETDIDLLVNLSPRRELWVMPSLLSHSRDTVRRFCRTNQLRLGQVHEVGYPGLPAGLVLRQYPPAGSPLERGDIITVWVSR
jgi:serine/threonine-protein kinase